MEILSDFGFYIPLVFIALIFLMAAIKILREAGVAIAAKRASRPKMMRTAPAVGPVVTIPDPQDPKTPIH